MLWLVTPATESINIHTARARQSSYRKTKCDGPRSTRRRSTRSWRMFGETFRLERLRSFGGWRATGRTCCSNTRASSMNHATWSRLRGAAFVAVFVTQTREKMRNLVILKFARLHFEYYFEASGLRAIVSQSIPIPYSRGDKYRVSRYRFGPAQI